ncbi:MAG: hypothetical protein KDA89_25250 [Planctomycetaceae bacterium]|nr:hypothetical protein [Planctomycetaceae bacterium]
MIDLLMRLLLEKAIGPENDTEYGKRVEAPAYICPICHSTDIGHAEWYSDDGETITSYGCHTCGAVGTRDYFSTGNMLGFCAYCGKETAVLCAKCTYAVCPDCLAQDKPPLCLDCY